MTQADMEKVTMQMFHAALEDAFLSIEEVPNARMADHLEPFIDVPKLHTLLHQAGKLEAPESIRSVARIVAETPMGKDMLDRRVVEKLEYASPMLLADLAFGTIYDDFSNWVEKSIVNSLTTMKRKFNPYAIVEVTPRLVRQRILSLELGIGDDIRHVYFEQQFPTGRYRSNDDDQLRDVQGVCTHIA